MKKVRWIVAIILMITAVAYISLMASFEAPICVDLSDAVQLSPEDQTLVLPWYLRAGTAYEFKLNGTDAEGNHYTRFCYSLHEVFESSELNCIVCWDTETATAFIGESRAMGIIDATFPTLQWNGSFSHQTPAPSNCAVLITQYGMCFSKAAG